MEGAVAWVQTESVRGWSGCRPVSTQWERQRRERHKDISEPPPQKGVSHPKSESKSPATGFAMKESGRGVGKAAGKKWTPKKPQITKGHGSPKTGGKSPRGCGRDW